MVIRMRLPRFTQPIKFRIMRRVAGLLGAAVVTLSGADASHRAAGRQALERALSRQRQAIASMAAPLEAQRRSVEKQLSRLPAPSFTLPALRPLPPVAGSPAPTWQAPSWVPFPSCAPMDSAELGELVDQAAEEADVEPDLLRGVIQQESAARPCAISPKGAMGLMQLMPSTAFQLGVADAFDPKQNVDGGARLLKQLLTLYGGDLTLALAAFNAGSGKVNEAGGVPDFPETLQYVRKVLAQLPSPE